MAPETFPQNFSIGAELVYTYLDLTACEDRDKARLTSRVQARERLSAFDQRRLDGEYNIVDLPVAGDVARFLGPKERDRLRLYPITSIPQGISRLQRIRDNLDPTTPDGIYLVHHTQATIMYLQALGGRNLPSREYITGTLGIDDRSQVIFQPVPEIDLDNKWQRCQTNLGLFDKPFRSRSDHDGWVRYSDENRKLPTKTAFREAEEQVMPIILEALNMPWPKFRIELASINTSWMNWTDYDKFGTRLRINTHEKVRDRFLEGSPIRLMPHEIEHALAGDTCARNIRLDLINPGYGTFCVPGPEQHGEGRANTMAYFIPELYESVSPQGRFLLDLRLYESWVHRNACLYANKLVPFDGDVVEYLMDNLPSMSAAKAQSFIDDATQDPRDRSYRLAYGFSYEYYQIAHRLAPKPQPRHRFLMGKPKSTPDKRAEFIRRSLDHPRTFTQILDLVDEIESQSSTGSGRGMLDHIVPPSRSTTPEALLNSLKLAFGRI